MSGWTYGKFCYGCPHELFCDWGCTYECKDCAAYPEFCAGKYEVTSKTFYGIEVPFACNGQVSRFDRFIRHIKYHLSNYGLIRSTWRI
jgi:hypothetical protein